MKRPVFLVGCPRSGTTLLYSMLVAAGGFAVYRKETYFYDLAPRFPTLSTPRARQQFLEQFLQGYLGKVPGLEVEPFVRAALAGSRRTEDFLPRLMAGIARAQGVDRWIEATPLHVLYMHEIARSVPDALFVHVIRDGRDCALSNDRQRWIRTLPWDRSRRLGVAALYWEWMVRAGRGFGRAHPQRYLEARFEDLIVHPRGVLGDIGRFIGHDLDYDRISRNPVHAMKTPNTSFRDERGRPDFNPVGRWEHQCSADDIKLCEALVGRYLHTLGYPLAYPDARPRPPFLMRSIYLGYFSVRHALKVHTPLGRYMTSTQAWAEQPRAGEQPVRLAPEPPAKVAGREYALDHGPVNR